MQVKVFIEEFNKNLVIDIEGKVIDLLRKLRINSNTVIVVCNGEIVTEDYKIEKGDRFSILNVGSVG